MTLNFDSVSDTGQTIEALYENNGSGPWGTCGDTFETFELNITCDRFNFPPPDGPFAYSTFFGGCINELGGSNTTVMYINPFRIYHAGIAPGDCQDGAGNEVYDMFISESSTATPFAPQLLVEPIKKAFFVKKKGVIGIDQSRLAKILRARGKI